MVCEYFIFISYVNFGSLLQIMRETLIYLSHLDHDDTEKQVHLYDAVISHFHCVLFFPLGKEKRKS